MNIHVPEIVTTRKQNMGRLSFISKFRNAYDKA